MGMDGLSMANTGALKESTSADFTNRTEQTMQADQTNNSKQVQTMSTNRRIREKDEDEENQKKKQEKEFEEELEDIFEQAGDDEVEEFDIEELDNPNKDFYVRLNAKDDIIELYESSSDRLIETISGNELQGLVKKLNMASGIFVNKKV